MLVSWRIISEVVVFGCVVLHGWVRFSAEAEMTWTDICKAARVSIYTSAGVTAIMMRAGALGMLI